MPRSRPRRTQLAVHPILILCAVTGLLMTPAVPLPGARTHAVVPVGIAAAAGECEAAGLIPVGSTGLCTHGSDPPLGDGGDRAVSAAEASTRPSLAICTG